MPLVTDYAPTSLGPAAVGCWKLVAAIILEAIDDAVRGNAGARAWIERSKELDDCCDMIGVNSDSVRLAYRKLAAARDGKFVGLRTRGMDDSFIDSRRHTAKSQNLVLA